MIARQQGRGLAAVAAEAGAAVVGGPLSLKAALDLDGDDPAARAQGLGAVLGALEAVEQWLDGTDGVAGQPEAADPAVRASRAAAEQVRAQDVVVGETDGLPALRRGVSRDRRISVEDGQMRHGRKSRSVRVDGYKRHVLHDLDSGLIRAVGVTAANAPEASVTDTLAADLAAQAVSLADLCELHIDRAYLSSRWVRERPPALAIYCKAWPVRTGPHFPKTAFAVDWERRTIRCPHQVERPFVPGGTVHFPASTCLACPLRALHRQSPRPQRPGPSR